MGVASSRGGKRYLSGSTSSLYPLILVAAGILAYLNSFSGVLLFDDYRNIVHNPLVRHPAENWRQILAFHRPLTTLSLAANYAFCQQEVQGYHAVNLAIHLLAGLALFGLARRVLLVPGLADRLKDVAPELALAIALLWLLHPLQTESVTYIVHRSEALAGLYYLLMLSCLLRGAEASGRRSWYVLAVGCCALGMVSKETMVTAPVAALLFDRAFLASSWSDALRRRWGLYLGLAATWILLGTSVLIAFHARPSGAVDQPAAGTAQHATPAGGPAPAAGQTAGFGLQGVTPLQYACSQPGILLYYLWLALWPSRLCVDYGWPVAKSAAEIVPAALGLLLLLGLSAWGWLRCRPVGFLGLWFFLVLAPTSSIMPVADLAAERRLYLPLAAVIALAALAGYQALEWLGQRLALTRAGMGRLELAGAALAAMMLGLLTYERNQDYQSSLAMWRDVTLKAPHNPRGHNNLGRALADEGKLAEAEKCHREALRLDPHYPLAYQNLGRIHAARRQWELAEQCFRRELEASPGDTSVLNNLGFVLTMQHSYDEAVTMFQRALQINAGEPSTHYNLGLTLMQQQKYRQAISHFRLASQLDPQDARCWNQLGRALLVTEHADEAIECLQQAVALSPDSSRYRRDLDLALQQKRTENNPGSDHPAGRPGS